LALDKEGKNVNVLLPFKKQLQGSVESQVFLHGVEISTNVLTGYGNGIRSPIEVQIVQSQTTYTGVTVTLSVTTSTRVFCVLVSFVAYTSTSNVHGGFYDQYNIIQNQITYQLTYTGSNWLAFYGFISHLLRDHL
jgi:hypothetical protein